MKPDHKRLLIKGIFLLVSPLLLFGLWVQGAHPGKAVLLITEKEAAMEEAPAETPLARVLETDRAKGPLILVSSPKEGEIYRTPLVVDLRFETPQDSAVDLDSLKVSYRKLIAIDITDRIRPYATEKGIYIPEADIPKGHHKIQIRIADLKGNVSLKDLAFSVQ